MILDDCLSISEYKSIIETVGWKKPADRLLERVNDRLEPEEEMMIQLLAAPGKIDFYKQFGFKVKLTTAEAGMYMWMKKA